MFCLALNVNGIFRWIMIGQHSFTSPQVIQTAQNSAWQQISILSQATYSQHTATHHWILKRVLLKATSSCVRHRILLLHQCCTPASGSSSAEIVAARKVGDGSSLSDLSCSTQQGASRTYAIQNQFQVDFKPSDSITI